MTDNSTTERSAGGLGAYYWFMCGFAAGALTVTIFLALFE